MRIAFFTNNYLPNVYGVPMSIETFRREFESLGHEVFIFAPNFPGYVDDDKNACLPERRVFRYPSLDINIKFRLPLGISYSPKMDKILSHLEIDIIHSHHPNLMGTAAMKWAEKKKVPLIFTWHTLYHRYTGFIPFLPAKFSANWIIKRAVKYANRASRVIVPTESIIPIIQKWGVHPHTKKPSPSFWIKLLSKFINFKSSRIKPKKFGVGVKNKIVPIATGVVESEFANPNRNEIREKYGIKNDEILLLLITRLTAEKNVDFLFDVVLDVLKKDNKIKFMLVGDGYLLRELKEKAQKENLTDKIIFTGLITEREVIKNYYAAGDIFVYASKSETQGMIITEAMYAGLPIVAVKATGVESLVENEVNGILVSEDKNEFRAAVEKLIVNDELRNKMSLASARIAREKYTSKISAQKMLEVYASLLK